MKGGGRGGGVGFFPWLPLCEGDLQCAELRDSTGGNIPTEPHLLGQRKPAREHEQPGGQGRNHGIESWASPNRPIPGKAETTKS